MKYNKKRDSNRDFNGTKGGETKPVVKVSDNNNKIGPGEAIQAKPLEVMVHGNNFDKALRTFRALVQKERIISTFKDRQSFEKRSDKRRRKINESKRKQLEFCSKGECQHAEHADNRKPKSKKVK
jgi:ribosomal protein S21